MLLPRVECSAMAEFIADDIEATPSLNTPSFGSTFPGLSRFSAEGRDV